MRTIIKELLAQTMSDLLKTKPLENIFVSDICQKSGVCRKTFYHYFRDKYDLATYITNSIYSKSLLVIGEYVDDYFSTLAEGNLALNNLDSTSVVVLQKFLQAWNGNKSLGKNLSESDDLNAPFNIWKERFIHGKKIILKKRLESMGKKLSDSDMELAGEMMYVTAMHHYALWDEKYGTNLPPEAAMELIQLMNKILDFWIAQAEDI